MLNQELSLQSVTSSILNLPNRPPIMLGPDLAEFYETRSDAINQAVRRNPQRFPEDFCFQLTENELSDLRSQNATANGDLLTQNVLAKISKSRFQPFAFTQAGALALSGVLKTQRAAEVSVIVFRAFAETIKRQRPLISTHEIPTDEYIDLLKSRNRLALLEQHQRRRLSEADQVEILRLREAGRNNGEIGRAIQRPRATVASFLRRTKKAENNG